MSVPLPLPISTPTHNPPGVSKPLSFPRGNPCLLAKPSHKWLLSRVWGVTWGGYSQKTVMERSQSTWFVGTIQVLATRFTHALGMTKMFQSMSRNLS